MSDQQTFLFFWGLFWLLVLATCAFAFWKGGPAERYGALLIVGFALLWESSRYLPDGMKASLPILQLVGDGATALGLLAIAIRYASPWLGGALLFQAAQFTLHSLYLVTNRPHDHLHALINNVNLYAILSCLILGTVVEWRRRSKAES